MNKGVPVECKVAINSDGERVWYRLTWGVELKKEHISGELTEAQRKALIAYCKKEERFDLMRSGAWNPLTITPNKIYRFEGGERKALNYYDSETGELFSKDDLLGDDYKIQLSKPTPVEAPEDEPEAEENSGETP